MPYENKMSLKCTYYNPVILSWCVNQIWQVGQAGAVPLLNVFFYATSHTFLERFLMEISSMKGHFLKNVDKLANF